LDVRTQVLLDGHHRAGAGLRGRARRRRGRGRRAGPGREGGRVRGPGRRGLPGGPGAGGRDDVTGAAATDPRLGRLHVLVDSLIVAEAALEAGAPTLQVRLKNGSDGARYRLEGGIPGGGRGGGG